MATSDARQRTHRRVLPQPAALECTGADTPGRDGTARADLTGNGRVPGIGHGRGETRTRRTRAHGRHPETATAAEGDRGLTAPHVFVLDKNGDPLMPCHPARARKLLASGRAVVHRHTPFVIRLTDRTVAESVVPGVEAGLPVYTGSGGRTKWNRSRTGAPKSHTLDALHVGDLGNVTAWPAAVLTAAATGRGSYARTAPNRYGFPRLRLLRVKQIHGFATPGTWSGRSSRRERRPGSIRGGSRSAPPATSISAPSAVWSKASATGTCGCCKEPTATATPRLRKPL
ncbi:hypothetical protein Pve01_51750 [Planomonospora venezuelensis]|uniref:RRXRR domain-containing protein n=2 Tax=Planomonospora venezuelensis TaxID=1999 RepID=A0A841D9I5_PLAVE|nr:hypothetical protein [Planomonospora venezuelensis]GIN03517.1 hypothetical protein Pve01_51750 [Planomonospora venezuelensis]